MAAATREGLSRILTDGPWRVLPHRSLRSRPGRGTVLRKSPVWRAAHLTSRTMREPSVTNRRQRRANSRDTVRVERIDRSTPGPIRVRCRIPFAFDATMGLVRTGSTPVSDSPATSAAAPVDVSGSAAIAGRAESAGGEQITGAASSTSIDWYGTRMGRSALESMARQFAAGVDYFPRNHSWTASVEWYEVIADERREIGRDGWGSAEGFGTGDARVLCHDRSDFEEELAKSSSARSTAASRFASRSAAGSGDAAGMMRRAGHDIEVRTFELDHRGCPLPANRTGTMTAVTSALVEAGGEIGAPRDARAGDPR